MSACGDYSVLYGAQKTYLKMGVTRHNAVNLLLGPGNHDLDDVLEEILELLHLTEEPDPHISCDLVITGSTGVELSCYIFYMFQEGVNQRVQGELET